MFSSRNCNKVLLLMIFVLSLCNVHAETVDYEEAQKVAINFMNRSFGRTPKVSDVITFDTIGFTTMYAFNFEDGGFVLVSGSYNSDPILAYSRQEIFQPKNEINNVSFLELLNEFESIILSRENTMTRSGTISESNMKWEEWINEKNPYYGTSTEFEIMAVSNLLYDSLRGGAVKWNQYGCQNCNEIGVENPKNILYEAMMPPVENKCEHAIAGCGPIALAQTLWKWKYPESLKYTYKDNTYISEYNWDLMPNTLTNESSVQEMNEIATLIRDCAYIQNASFGCYSISSGSINIKNAIDKYLTGYNSYEHISSDWYLSSTKFDNIYSVSEWTEIILTELIAGRPIITWSGALTPAGLAGHIFVITGFERRSDGPYFTVNFGWGGKYENVFYNLDFSDRGLSLEENLMLAHRKSAIIGLSPKKGNENGEHSITAICEQSTISESGIGKLSFSVREANSYLVTIKYTGEEKISLNSNIYQTRDFFIYKGAGNITKSGLVELWYSSNAHLENEIETQYGKGYAPTTYEVTFFNNYGEIVTYKGTFEKVSLTGENSKRNLIPIELSVSNRQLYVGGEGSLYSLIITNAKGAKVYESIRKITLPFEINLSTLPSGIYNIDAKSDKGKTVEQLILK